MIGMDILKRLEENINKTVTDFEARDDISTSFGKAITGYANTRSPLFDMMFTRRLCDHPKNIYRPGNTVILHFVPYSPHIISENEKSLSPSKAWETAFRESMWLSMKLNGVIRETLNMVGRLSSCTNTPVDWNEKLCHENWSHKMAAYAAGMGEFGPGGSFHTKGGYAGRLSSIITDGLYAEDFTPMSDGELRETHVKLLKDCCFQGSGIVCSSEMIASCPAGAIHEDGIDRMKCQSYCKTIDEFIPSPEVCGKCFRFK